MQQVVSQFLFEEVYNEGVESCSSHTVKICLSIQDLQQLVAVGLAEATNDDSGSDEEQEGNKTG